ncbi:MAG: S8 family serine peptidase [Bacteroidales bacterium]|nr:S8 family serine peptidase [Bacteroidales bacterium]MCM1416329.1 S8 family serine peptidase [bacterium]MCM1423258.1 S8 family serine peptidase [bacterium]
MDSQKNENLLNLALDTAPVERERSLELNVGYDDDEKTWEVIVKYHGSLEGLAAFGIRVEELIAGYAILTVPETQMERLAQIEQIEYVEKPKRLFFSDLQGSTASCFAPGSALHRELTGRGVLVAVIDSGISYWNEDFRKQDGSTRIRFLWDQVLGREFGEQEINAALAAGSRQAALQIVPSIDTSGHGTAVAGIAAGNGGARGAAYTGIARESDLLIVRLGTPRADSFPRTTELMRALTYAVNKARELAMPLAVNLSFGNTYGAHNGSSLLERFLDNIAEIGRTVICAGSGNEGASGGHVGGSLRENESRRTVTDSVNYAADGTDTAVSGQDAVVEMAVGAYETGLNVQLWKEYADRYLVTVLSPSGSLFTADTDRPGKQSVRLGQTQILFYNGEPAPYMTSQELYFDFLPAAGNRYLEQGVWTFRLHPQRIVTGNYTFYLPSAAVLSADTRFVRPTPDVTLTIPSTASGVITVGAYDPVYESYADFSGRGYLYQEQVNSRTSDAYVKPDLVAPGVGVIAPDRNGGLSAVTGTSFAAPFVTGAAALLMQWGIVLGNDPYLYGEKVKAYLRKGAKPIRGVADYPDARAGYGALCISASLPE